jgi:hypothetical protein
VFLGSKSVPSGNAGSSPCRASGASRCASALRRVADRALWNPPTARQLAGGDGARHERRLEAPVGDADERSGHLRIGLAAQVRDCRIR